MLGLHSAQLEQSSKMFHRNQTTPFTKVVFTDSQSDRQTTARMTIRGTCSIIQDAILPCSFSQSEASILLGRGTHYIIWISFFFFLGGGIKLCVEPSNIVLHDVLFNLFCLQRVPAVRLSQICIHKAQKLLGAIRPLVIQRRERVSWEGK